MCELLFPDPVHQVGGALLEDFKVLFLHTLRCVQEHVEVQVTRALDLYFAAHVFWKKCGRGRFRLHLLPTLLPRQSGPSTSPPVSSAPLSPPEAPGPSEACPFSAPAQHPATPTSSTHASSSGWDWWFQVGGTRRCPGQGPHPRESRKSRALWGEPPGSAVARGGGPGVSGGSEQLLTAADGLHPTPDPFILALSLHRPRQHQIRGAAVADLVAEAEARSRPHCTHGNARVGAVAGCEEQRKMEMSRDPPPQPLGAARTPFPARLFLLYRPSEPLRVPWPLPWETPQLCLPGVWIENLK